MRQLVLRADDLGYSEGVNLGIVKSVKEGLIGNVGVMTNMPEAGSGLVLLKDSTVCLGQHTTISSGRPIVNPAYIPSLVRANGDFKSSAEYRKDRDEVVIAEVILEIEAQLQEFIRLTGEQPSYIDGHAVMSPNFFKGLAIVASQYQLKYSAVPSNLTEPVLIGRTPTYLHAGSSEKTSPFEVLQTVVNQTETTSNLIVYHPGYLDAYLLRHSSLTTQRPFEVEMLCGAEAKHYLAEREVKLVTYHDL